MVTLGSKVRINDGATVMPFTVVGDNITLLTQCTTIKGMELRERKYHFFVSAMKINQICLIGLYGMYLYLLSWDLYGKCCVST